MKFIPQIRKLGFRFLEMEGLGPSLLRSLYRNCKLLQQTAVDSGVHIHNFCIVDPSLVSLNPQRRAGALEKFKMGAEIGELLRAETLHLASYAPPVQYLNHKPYQLGGKGGYSFRDRFEVRIPKGFNWDQVWRPLLESCQACADIAAGYRKTVIMEPRVGKIICSVDSLLRLIEHVARPNFKASFDTAHFSTQREDVVVALCKLRHHFANIHLADNNPVSPEHLPIGDGVIDWKEFFRVLKSQTYRGYLGLDLGATPSLVKDYRKSVERVRKIGADLKLPIEV